MQINPVLSPLLMLPGMKHAFFTREGGVSQGVYAGLNGGIGSSDDPDAIAQNRALMAGYMGCVPEKFLSLYQVHSADVVTVETPWASSRRPHADGMVTKMRGISLAIGTADCGPILFADYEAGVIGAAHAGWKGAVGGVLDATIEAMEALGADRQRMVVALGPMLSSANYEVGPEFKMRFLNEDAANERFFVTGSREGHPHFDLPGYIHARLKWLGVSQIWDSALCTYADEPRFYSYRRMTHRKEADYGRLIAAISLT